MRLSLAAVALLLVPALPAAEPAAPATPSASYPFQNPDLPPEPRIDDLIGRMTLDEKIDCMAMSAAVPRLGVKGTRHIEGYHGVAQGGPSNWGQRNPTPTTQFPQAYGLGETWDPDLIRQVAAQEAEEARYLTQSPSYNRAGLIIRAPNADLARDPRWGRTEESFGEDPFLTGTLAVAFVRGLQGDDPRYLKTASLVKHFLANSNEDGREHSSSNFSERLWREYYAKPFEMAIVDGHAPAMMASYNAVNGTPQHVNPSLRAIVMNEWKLDGIVCTDGGGLHLLVDQHHAFPDLPAAAAACVKAGINHFLDRHKEPLTEAIKRGLITEKDLDAAIRGLFRVSLRLGLLDPDTRVPYASIGRTDAPEPWARPETRTLVRTVTEKSIVLLKNSAGLLPLDRTKLKKIAVVGPLANTVLADWYGGTPPYHVSPVTGLERVAGPKVKVDWMANMTDAAVAVARDRDAAIVCIGNDPIGEAGWEIVRSPSEGKEAVDRKDIVLQPDQEDFVRRVYAANPNTIVVLLANFPYAMPWIAEHATTILHATHASQELGNALANVVFGEANPGGKLTQTWPKSLAQLPPMMDYDLTHGRTYLYFAGEPQYPFGYGLSYSTFALTNLRTDSATISRDTTLHLTVDVKNTSTRAGDEVIQLYVRYPESKVSRPLKQLRAFSRVTIAPGETKSVPLTLRASDLAYWSSEHHAWALEPGRVELLVGTSSAAADLGLHQTMTVSP